MIDNDCKVIMEVHKETMNIPLSLTSSIRIPPHTIAVAVVECAKPLNFTMDIRADAGFLRDFPNIHVACPYINNPKESLAPNCIPFAFTNLSMYSQYLGKDKVVCLAQPTAEDVEVHALADHDELAEMMWGPRNHIPHKQQAKYKLPIIPLDNAFITSPVDIPGPRKVDLQDADITPSTRSAFDALCEKYPKVFSKGNEDIGRTQLVTMDIDMEDVVSSRPYTLALKHHKWVHEEIETLQRVGVITKSMSPWASPIVIVPNKSQPGEPPKKRLCIDFRKINDLQQKVITEGKSKGCLPLIPLPKIDKMYAKLKEGKFFLTIDLRSGYYQIALGKDSRAKTAFVMPFGKYKFLQVPFGLAQAPAFFQHLMNKVLDNCPFAMTYLDDIIIFSDTEEEHLAHIEEIFRRLEAADLKMKRSKCDFFKKHIHYLGHLISADGI